jgi:hypothetical protein
MSTDPAQQTIEEAFLQLSRMTDEYFSSMTPQERDRMLQSHLAQARGSKRNGDLLRHMLDGILLMRASLQI